MDKVFTLIHKGMEFKTTVLNSLFVLASIIDCLSDIEWDKFFSEGKLPESCSIPEDCTVTKIKTESK